MRFTSVSAHYWRLTIAAMGAGLVPKIVGLWLGATWEPGFVRPLEDEHGATMGGTFETELGWRGRTQPVRRRDGTITLQLSDTSKEAAAQAALDLFDLHPMWIIHNANEANRAVLADHVAGHIDQLPGWHPRSGRIDWVEREPKF